MERLFLFILLSLFATNTVLAQVPKSTGMAEPPPNYLAIDSEIFQEHITQIVHKREIKEKICNKKTLQSNEVYVSLGRDRPFTRFERNKPLCCDRFDIYLKNNEDIFFHPRDKYLRVINVRKIGDDIFYEVITHSGGKGKISDELHCIFNFRYGKDGYKLVKSSVNQKKELNIKQL